METRLNRSENVAKEKGRNTSLHTGVYMGMYFTLFLLFLPFVIDSLFEIS